MTEFKKGDKVRLKLKPEIEGVVVGPELWHPNKIRFDTVPDTSDARYDVYNRWPEEIELVFCFVQVGDWVRRWDHQNWMKVLAVVPMLGEEWVIVDSSTVDGNYPYSYLVEQVERKP